MMSGIMSDYRLRSDCASILPLLGNRLAVGWQWFGSCIYGGKIAMGTVLLASDQLSMSAKQLIFYLKSISTNYNNGTAWKPSPCTF